MNRNETEVPADQCEFEGYTIPLHLHEELASRGFSEISWHNDISPSYSKDEDQIRVWIEHQSPEMREAGKDAPRFSLTVHDETGSFLSGDHFETVEEVLAALDSEGRN